MQTNPRVTPEKLVAQNLEQAFLTAITFHEAPIISQWYGPGYDLPTSEEWQCALHTFAAIAAHPSFVKRIVDLSALHPRAGELVEACERALPAYQRVSERRLSHQLMMSPGILEYVYQDAARTRCQACGLSFQVLRSHAGTIMALRHPEQGEWRATLGMRPLLHW